MKLINHQKMQLSHHLKISFFLSIDHLLHICMRSNVGPFVYVQILEH